MICFCDKEVYCINENEANRQELFSFFIKKEHLNDIVVVYDDNGGLSGIITYKSVLHNQTNFIQKGKVKISDNMWTEANKLFDQNNKAEFYPLVNDKDELLYFCFKANESVETNYIDEFLGILERHEEKVFINDLYPNVQAVYIYDMNEWAYRFYCCLQERNFPVIVNGEKWQSILKIKSAPENHPDFSILNIYSDGPEMMISRKYPYYLHEHNFKVLRELCLANRLYWETSFKKSLTSKNNKMIVCNIPELNELDFCTPDELYRKKFIIYPNSNNDNSPIKNEQFIKASGLSMERFNYLHSVDEKILCPIQGIDLHNGKTIKCNRYGSGKNRIYIILPPCMAHFATTRYKDSLCQVLLRSINLKYDNQYEIIAIPLFDLEISLFIDILQSLNLGKNDIIISISRHYKNQIEKFNFEKYIDLEFAKVLNKRPLDEAWFYDGPIHLNDIGTNMLVKELFDFHIEPYIIENTTMHTSKVEYLTNSEKKELDKYLSSIESYKFSTEKDDRIGSIVMNCNPFTNGHLYLIEQALLKIDYLYIFVVEEDKSFFKFEDRIELVRLGTEKYNNVRVIPSGEFILSYTTLPGYFEKEKNQEIIIDASSDINIFGKYIAPFMGINMRFAGEEPLDKITNQYNEEMERALKVHGIEFIQIPRIRDKEEVVSASRVRKLLKDKNWNDIKDLVPITTLNFLKNFS